jgi:hypothetical protein
LTRLLPGAKRISSELTAESGDCLETARSDEGEPFGATD